MPPRYIDSLSRPKISGFQWQDPENEADRKSFRDILEHGCQIISVAAGPTTPDFSYSVGLYLNFHHPEIIVMGLASQTAFNAINRIKALAEAGDHLKPGDIRSDIFEIGHPVRFDLVDPDYYFDYIGFTAWFYRSLLFIEPVMEHKFPLVRATWPDKELRYPDDPNCHPDVRRAQTLVKQKGPNVG